MKSAVIKILKKIEIDQSSSSAFAQDIFNDSYNELSKQIKFASNSFSTWEHVVTMNPDMQTKITANVSIAIRTAISKLDGFVPNDFKDTTNSIDIKFENYQIQILSSDVQNKSNHRIVVYLIFPEMTLVDSFGDRFLLCFGDKANELTSKSTLNPFIINFDSTIFISDYKLI